MKQTIILVLLITICFIIYNIYKTNEYFLNPIKIVYKVPLKAISKKITINNLEATKTNSSALYIGSRYLDKNMIKSLKQVPLIFKNEVCLEDECISYNKIKELKHFFPYGSVIAYSGDKENIPFGWAICDGTNDTPDLQSKFVMGSDTNSYSSIGGKPFIQLNKDNIPEHVHDVFIPKANSSGDSSGVITDTHIKKNIKPGNGFFLGGSENAKDSNDSSKLAEGKPIKILPAFYKLIYIMRILPNPKTEIKESCVKTPDKNPDGTYVKSNNKLLTEQLECLKKP